MAEFLEDVPNGRFADLADAPLLELDQPTSASVGRSEMGRRTASSSSGSRWDGGTGSAGTASTRPRCQKQRRAKSPNTSGAGRSQFLKPHGSPRKPWQSRTSWPAAQEGCLCTRSSLPAEDLCSEEKRARGMGRLETPPTTRAAGDRWGRFDAFTAALCGQGMPLVATSAASASESAPVGRGTRSAGWRVRGCAQAVVEKAGPA